MEAYQANCDDIAAGFIESDALAVSLEALINESDPVWEGTLTDLMGKLTGLDADFRAPEWAIKSLPSTPQGLNTWLKRIMPKMLRIESKTILKLLLIEHSIYLHSCPIQISCYADVS